MSKRTKRVFILGSGAALGAHHVGALKYLEEQDIVPDAIIGSSIGVINACAYASGGVARLEEAWHGFSSLPRIFSPSLRHNPVVGLSLFSMERLASAIEQYMDFEKMLASPLELEFVLLNVSRGRAEMHAKRDCADCFAIIGFRSDQNSAPYSQWFKSGICFLNPLSFRVDEGVVFVVL